MTYLMMAWNWVQDMQFLWLPVYISLRPLVWTLIVIGRVEMQLLLLLLTYRLAAMEFQHLKIVKESYRKHLWFTIKLSSILLILSVCAIIHGLLPSIMLGVVSDKIKHLNAVLSER